ncbi:MAG TPA: nucleotidyltransferase domain-containing protein [Epsilonproteobacteria bacterium]|nr:nucleotidyltransferase domain-containing protein [Campylobacterota bacterium]
MKLEKEQIECIIDHLHSQIPALRALYLFGSYADGTANHESDVDVAFLSDALPDSVARWEIAQALARKLHADVDLVDLRSTNTIFRYQILSTGERIYGEGYEVEYFETLAYSFYLRFKEERKPIIDEILKNGEVFKSA